VIEGISVGFNVLEPVSGEFIDGLVERVGEHDVVGSNDGFQDGTIVGARVGLKLGEKVGRRDGNNIVGRTVGFIEGLEVDGSNEGL